MRWRSGDDRHHQPSHAQQQEEDGNGEKSELHDEEGSASSLFRRSRGIDDENNSDSTSDGDPDLFYDHDDDDDSTDHHRQSHDEDHADQVEGDPPDLIHENESTTAESSAGSRAEAAHHHHQSQRSENKQNSLAASNTSTSATTTAADASLDDDDNEDAEGAATPYESSSSSSSPPPKSSQPLSSSAESNIEWQPQTQQSTCEFTHTITNYAQKRESGCKKAEYSATTVDDFGNRWRLIVYVNGNGRASNHHLSLFLQVADAEELPFGWKKAVSYVLTLEHPSGTNMGYAKRNPDKTFKLCPKAIDWGWSQFITSDRIQQEQYIQDDSLLVRASVTVKYSSVSIDPEDAELYLKCAVEEGNADAVKLCLAQGASVNCQFKDDLYTPLHTACSSSTSTGSLEVLNLLLERGADGNACNKWRETPLLIAANNGHKAAVDLLLQNKADPSLCSEAGWSALTFAAHKGYDDIVTLLLKSGAPVNCRVTEDLSTPLHKACAGGKPGHLSAVKQLLEWNADVHALNKWKETPLLTAANHGQAAAVEALLKAGGDPCKCTDTGWSPLSIAAYKGHDDVVRLLLEEGAPTEEADPTLSALLQAATKGLPDTVELLLRHGADHTVTTKKGDTALSILVEQNLIDAAVEMVTEYKASIPRCSRDRKKVQRARLLINLQVKKQQREGLLQLSSDDDETDQESEESKTALHDENGASPKTAVQPSGANKKNKKKKKRGNKLSAAEEQARAAEEALLLELEQEESKAQKDEAAANSKRAKKKKKKERERQQKLKEEQEQRAREEKEAKERERQQKIKEEKVRKEREQKEREEREQRERQMKQALEREKEAAAKRKQKEDKEKREKREKEKREREKRELFEKKAAEELAKSKPAVTKVTQQSSSPQTPPPEMASSNVPAPGLGGSRMPSPLPPAKNRGWETKNTNVPPQTEATKPPVEKSQSPVPPPPAAHVQNLEPRSMTSTDTTATPSSGGSAFVDKSPAGFSSVEDHLANMATGVVDFLGFDSPPQGRSGPPPVQQHQQQQGTSYAPTSNPMVNNQAADYASIEHPAVVLRREEKVAELLQRCAMLGAVDAGVVRAVIYRWIARAAHDKDSFLDPMIPSWTDFDALVAFLQRQLISESRKSGMPSNIEVLKEAGSTMAHLCHELAKDLVGFRSKVEEQVPQDWTDSSISVMAKEVMRNGGGSMVAVDWAGRAQVYIDHQVFVSMKDRHTGLPARFWTALFAVKKRYDTMRMIVNGTPMDFRLGSNTKAHLSRDAGVSVELWTDPFHAFGTNSFCGLFFDVDAPFGGLPSFGNDIVRNDMLRLKDRGGSVSVLLPLDSMVASHYVSRIVDILDEADKEGIPLSFAVFVPAECFIDLGSVPSANNLTVLDRRLGDRHGHFVACAPKVLSPGQHTFECGEGEGRIEISPTGSLFAMFQNESGKMHFQVREEVLGSILLTTSLNVVGAPRDAPTPMGFAPSATEPPAAAVPIPVGFTDSIGSLSTAPDDSRYEFGSLGGMPIGTNNNSNVLASASKRGHRGRLFELVDDGEEENPNDVDVMSGLLNNVDLFQSNASQDVNIDDIIFGGASIGGSASTGTRTTSRFT